jgi:hypothetical protein
MNDTQENQAVTAILVPAKQHLIFLPSHFDLRLIMRGEACAVYT